MFDEVYRIAIESNSFEEIKKSLNKFPIDALAIKNGVIVTAAGQLAREGQNNKVEWLRQLGANVNAIAQGYAVAGDHEKVEAYRKEYKETSNDIALGYAVAGHHERVEAYRTENCENVNAIALGYALAGDHVRVETYRNKHSANVNAIARGYVLAGNHERVEAYRKEHGANVHAIALGYALAGHHEQVEAYRKDYGADVHAIARGYALAGHHERAEAYRKEHGTDVHAIPLGDASAGHHEKQKKYDINDLLDSYLEERTAVVDSSGSTKEYFYGSFFAVFQKSFTQKRDAVAALKSALSGDNVDLSEHLSTLRNGHLGKELRAFVKSGMGNALVGKEVNTVSDFVQALQDKNSNQKRTFS